MNGDDNLTYDILKLIASCKNGIIRNQIKKYYNNAWLVLRELMCNGWIVRKFDGRYYKYYITSCGNKQLRKIDKMTKILNENEWYYYVRIGTNDRWINYSNVVNVCRRDMIEPLLTDHLNRYEMIWEAMSIADYNEMFGVVNNV